MPGAPIIPVVITGTERMMPKGTLRITPGEAYVRFLTPIRPQDASSREDLMARVRAAARIRRETPVTWTQKDGTLIEGVLDLAFDEGERTTVVDFKTDHELSAGEARYRAQLQKYVDAVALATERPARGVLFKV